MKGDRDTRRPRVGVVILPQEPWREARRKWGQAEELGFDHVWTYDHLAWGTLADESWGATVPTLTAAALATSTIRIGTFVATPNFRHPVPFAKEVATIDEISNGRLLLGLGSGGLGVDSVVLGQASLTAHERHERFVEFVGALDELLRFERANTEGITREGRWYSAVNARMVGRPAQSPRTPFVIAANGVRGLDLAARKGQAWVTTGPRGVSEEDWWVGVARLSLRLNEVLEKSGRPATALDRYLSLDASGMYSLSSTSTFRRAADRAAELGFTDVVVHWPRAGGLYSGDERVLEHVVKGA